MTTRGETPLVELRRLRGRLRQARRDMKLTQQDVAEALDWSTSKLIRIENGSVGISVTDLKAILDHYKITDQDDVDRLVEIARGSKKSSWWHEYRSRVPGQFFTFLGLEASAIRIRQYQNLVMPGLLQAPAYIDELATRGATDEDNAIANLEIRRRRQELITGENGVESSFILDESVLYRQIGGPEVMREQLEKLKELQAYPNISIRVMSFAMGAYQGMKVSFEVLELSDDQDDYALLIEHPYKDQLVPDPNEETRQFVQSFRELEELALPVAETVQLIDERLRDLKGSA